MKQHPIIRLTLSGLTALCVLLLSGCMGSNYYYERGQKAYQRQDFHQSLADTLASAKLGNVKGQYATGYMYYYGIGTPQNDYLAAYWFKRAADVGDPQAEVALKQIKARASYPFLFGLDRSQAGQPAPRPKPIQTKKPAKSYTTQKPRTTYRTKPHSVTKPKGSGEYLPPPHSTYTH